MSSVGGVLPGQPQGVLPGPSGVGAGLAVAMAPAEAGAVADARYGTVTVPKQIAAMAVTMTGRIARRLMCLVILPATSRRVWLAGVLTRSSPNVSRVAFCLLSAGEGLPIAGCAKL
jgi:hypothetical protein